MAKCTKCGYRWKAKDIWKLSVAKDGKACRNCQAKQYVSFEEGGFWIGLGQLSGLMGLLLIVFFPLFMKLTDTKENRT